MIFGIDVLIVLIVVLGVVLVWRGPKILPKWGEALGRGVKATRKEMSDLQEEARARGYHVAAINSEPLSRPIAAKCGFKEYSHSYIYGWMPVIDLEVILALDRSLDLPEHYRPSF